MRKYIAILTMGTLVSSVTYAGGGGLGDMLYIPMKTVGENSGLLKVGSDLRGGIKGEDSDLRFIPALVVGGGGADGGGAPLYEEGESSGGLIYLYIKANRGSFNRRGDSFGNQKMLAEGKNSEGRSYLVSDGGGLDTGGRNIIPNEELRGGDSGGGRTLTSVIVGGMDGGGGLDGEGGAFVAGGGIDGGGRTLHDGDLGGNRGGSFNRKINS